MFDHVEHKLSYLSERYTSQQLREWYDLIESCLEQNREVQFAPGALRALALDACYCVVRHFPWANTTLFQDLFTEVLVDEYRLSPHVAKSIHMNLCVRLQIAPATTGKDDREIVEEFLKFIFVQSVCASDDNELMRDLGFGSQLLRRLRKTAQSTIDKKSGATASEHGAPAEQIFSKIMLKMSKQVRRLPWIVDLYRLQFLVFGPSSKYSGKVAFRYNKTLFRMLLLLGRRRNLSAAKLEEWLTNRLDVNVADELRLTARTVLEQLQNLQLIFKQQSPETGISNWSLATAGLELTAEAFAVIANRKPIDNDRILSLHPIYQAAVIRNLPQHANSQLRELMLYHAQTLSPPGLEQCVLQLAKTGEYADLAELTINLITRIQATWSKAALYKALSSLPTIPTIGQRLAAMAESESSPRVKNAAFEAIAKHLVKDAEPAKANLLGESRFRTDHVEQNNP